MRCRLFKPLALTAVLLFTAFSTGSTALLACALLIVCMVVFALVSVRLAVRTLSAEVSLGEKTIRRGDDVRLKVVVTCGCLLPVAPIRVELQAMPGAEPTRLLLSRDSGRRQKTTATIHAGHVGVSRPGAARCEVSDVFGFFTCMHKPAVTGQELVVLPQTFEVAELTYAPGDNEMETLSRATEDITNPSDVRTYAPGDPMKKIHWKLSLRKRELLVRRFEEPALPDALVLMDCSAPRAETPAQAADLRDALAETAASLLSMPLDGHIMRLPLMGTHPVHLFSSMGLPLVMENLARCDFSETDKFERVLMMEGRRMSRVGCCVVITARLNGAVVQAITQIRRMGPAVRVYLITDDPESERNLRYVSRLQSSMCEVAYVRPEPM